jgi:hypothetical protein
VLGLDVSPAQVAQAKQTVQADNLHFQVSITGHKKGLFSSCARYSIRYILNIHLQNELNMKILLEKTTD